MKTINLLASAIMMVSLCSSNLQSKPKTDTEIPPTEDPAMNTLIAEEKSEGWVLLFDGVSTDG